MKPHEVNASTERLAYSDTVGQVDHAANVTLLVEMHFEAVDNVLSKCHVWIIIRAAVMAKD